MTVIPTCDFGCSCHEFVQVSFLHSLPASPAFKIKNEADYRLSSATLIPSNLYNPETSSFNKKLSFYLFPFLCSVSVRA